MSRASDIMSLGAKDISKKEISITAEYTCASLKWLARDLIVYYFHDGSAIMVTIDEDLQPIEIVSV